MKTTVFNLGARSFVICLTFILSTATAASRIFAADIKPENLSCEYLQNPLVVDVANPRLSWVNIATPDARGQVQTGYQIQVSTSKEKLLAGQADLWDTNKVSSDLSVRVKYAGKALASRQDCWWHVRTWDRDEHCVALASRNPATRTSTLTKVAEK